MASSNSQNWDIYLDGEYQETVSYPEDWDDVRVYQDLMRRGFENEIEVVLGL